jgi:hypothetical protein
LLDLVVVYRGQSAKVWRNTSQNAGRWAEVELQQPAPNRDAIGAWIEVRRGSAVTRREITVGGGHASGESGWWHFGLGEDTEAEVRVTWPDGTAGDWQRVDGNNFYILERDKPAQVWTAKPTAGN